MKHKSSRNCKRLLLALGLGVGLCGFTGYALPTPASAAEVQQAARSLVVESVTVQGNQSFSEQDILRLLPILADKRVDVDKLSRQIQLVNDTRAVTLKADFKPNPAGGFDVTINVEELQREHHVLTMNNTGNDYTGDWRFNYTYINTNLSHRADTLGIAGVTSPGHMSDVKQAAVVYRQILPKAGDSIYFSYSYSDVDMGQIASFGSLSMNATGKGHAYGLHYQHNLNYSANKKNWLDFGIDYKDYQNAQSFAFDGTPILRQGTDFSVATVGLTYGGSIRGTSQATSYSLGYVTNINGDRNKYNNYRAGSDKQFGILKAGVNHQYKMGAGWLGSVRMNAQYTRDNLLTTEQLGAGGMYSVRGFDERAISADNGYIINIEFYTPEVARGQRFVVFSDIGHLYNNRANIGELNNDTIASVGVGYRYSDAASGWSGALDYAYVVDDIDHKNDQDSGKWHVTVSKKF